MDYVKVRHGAVALLFPGLILKLLQGDPLGVGVDTQHLGRLGGGGGGGRGREGEGSTQQQSQGRPNDFFIWLNVILK